MASLGAAWLASKEVSMRGDTGAWCDVGSDSDCSRGLASKAVLMGGVAMSGSSNPNLCALFHLMLIGP